MAAPNASPQVGRLTGAVDAIRHALIITTDDAVAAQLAVALRDVCGVLVELQARDARHAMRARRRAR
jgi:hypothetical protein